MPKTVFIFYATRRRGRWRLLRFCEPTRDAAERTAAGWLASGADVRIVQAEVRQPTPDAAPPAPAAPQQQEQPAAEKGSAAK